MSDARDLLIEIGTEELPPKALRQLSLAFADAVSAGLEAAGLEPARAVAYATPRRLAVFVGELPTAQPDRETVRRGPALSAAFDEEGNATPAASGFARSCGVTVEQLEQLENDKGSWLAFRAVQRGQVTAELIPDLVRKALAALPIPKRMRWGERTDEFVRPVHWVVLLFGDQVISADILGVTADRYTRGHRFHHPDPIFLGEPQSYLAMLETEGQVVADYATRREAVRAQVMEQAKLLDGRALIDEELLDEVTALVEWPVALSGRFDEGFLEVPPEALISSMQDHQKYFPVVDAQGELLPHFITVANLVSKDPAQIRAGNERVIRPRLADAAFFWGQDRKRTLAQRSDGLRNMVFEQRLGTLFDKQQRVAALAATIAKVIDADPEHARRAALLCKCDLLTSMVFEFPELQGVMGRYYALHDGEAPAVAEAIREHYLPRFSGDALPLTPAGQALALADRLDSLVGIFAIGQQPSGDRDPFALRRAAVGTVRICIERQLDLDLKQALQAAAGTFGSQIHAEAVIPAVFDYVVERLRGYYHEAEVESDLIEAVLATRPARPLDVDRRIQACRVFRGLPEAASLAAANKRISNILKKWNQPVPGSVDPQRLTDAAEKRLSERLTAMRETVSPLLDAGDYTQALIQLASLREPVDAFFDNVMVMVDDEDLRDNRLALLKNLGNLFLRVADLSRLQN